MKLIKKIYCRSFQAVFKAAIPILPYRKPEILSSATELYKPLRRKNIKRILIVCDRNVLELGLAEPMKKSLEENEIEYFVYDKTVPNPTVQNVEEARKMYIDNDCRGLIGFGGGSAIDCAKAVGARIARKNRNIAEMAGILKIFRPLPFIAAVPTTAGTGSETTVATIITDEATKHKYAICDLCLIPAVAVHDAQITKTLPPHITAATGMDVLTHAIEAYIGRSTVKSTREDALCAARMVKENLEIAYKNGQDTKARENMLYASFLAGRAFAKSYVGYCHAVAHTLGGNYNVPHGLANAVLLPYVLESYGDSIHKKAKDIAVAMGIAEKDTPESIAAKLLIEKIRQMNRNMGIPDKIKGIRKEDIADMAAFAEKEANPLYPVPVLMTAKELEKFYYIVAEENYE